ncbi:RNA-directed DNA polymerase, eukaryota [Tanacetum coccineum]
METGDLWKLCDRHGIVADVYIASKLSKIGQRFGFVWFICVSDLTKLIEDLKKVWIGNHHLFAAKARFDRKPVIGLPLWAWTNNAFKKIASAWGEPLFVDDDPNECMAICREDEEGEIKEHGIPMNTCPEDCNDQNPENLADGQPSQENKCSWAGEASKEDNSHSIPQQELNEDRTSGNVQTSSSNSPSKPPSFENIITHSSKSTFNKGKSASKHSSSFSFIDEKSMKEGVRNTKFLEKSRSLHRYR